MSVGGDAVGKSQGIAVRTRWFSVRKLQYHQLIGLRRRTCRPVGIVAVATFRVGGRRDQRSRSCPRRRKLPECRILLTCVT